MQCLAFELDFERNKKPKYAEDKHQANRIENIYNIIRTSMYTHRVCKVETKKKN